MRITHNQFRAIHSVELEIFRYLLFSVACSFPRSIKIEKTLVWFGLCSPTSKNISISEFFFYSSCRTQDRDENVENVRRKAMEDPEVQQILADPAMQMILQQMQKDPKAVQELVGKKFTC